MHLTCEVNIDLMVRVKIASTHYLQAKLEQTSKTDRVHTAQKTGHAI